MMGRTFACAPPVPSARHRSLLSHAVPAVVIAILVTVTTVAETVASASNPVDKKASEKNTASGAPSQTAPSESATVTIDPPQARIGDRIRVTARSGPGSVGVGAPGLTIDQKLGAFRVLDVAASGDAVVVTVTPQETGELELPEFEVAFREPAGTPAADAHGAPGASRAPAQAAPNAVSPAAERRARVPARKITVRSVLGEGDATSLSELKPPADFETPWPWKTILGAGLAAAALIAAAFWLVRRMRRPSAPRPKPEEALPPGMTPDAWAREALAGLLAQGLLEAGRFRELHIALADLLRRYVELRFRVPALERTTEEIGDELVRALVGEEVSALAGSALEACDRVKFAKHRPAELEARETIEQVRRLVERTAIAPARGSAGLVPAAVETA